MLFRTITRALPDLEKLIVHGGWNCMAVLRALMLEASSHPSELDTTSIPQFREVDLMYLRLWSYPNAGEMEIRAEILRKMITQALESRIEQGHCIAILHIPSDICTDDWIAGLRHAQVVD
jgi:hypothetical protein